MHSAIVEPVPPGDDGSPVPLGEPRHPKAERTVSGTRFIAVLAVIVLVTVAFNVVMARRNARTADTRAAGTAVVNDLTRTRQRWTAVPDGMVATLTAIGDDPDTIRTIRRNMAFRRTEYLRANYSDPKFGNAQIPGRAVLEFGTANKQLNCRYRDIAGGGELRWVTTDSVMLESLKEWSAAVSSASAP